MPVQKKKSIYFAIELSLREISFAVHVHALMTRKSRAVGMCNAILRNHLKTKNDKFDTLFKTKIPKNIPWLAAHPH